ncbi:uncharacterized protein [Mytilus edulis]|uniref:uncharacterized protein n=1 Tax=Mytilus edulis TaxID=6550 RepID=UPI0039F0BE66
MQTGHVTKIACIAKETLQSTFLDTYPIGITVVAVIRFRLAICRENADIVVSNAFFLMVTVCSFVLALITAATKLIVRITTMESNSSNKTGSGNYFCFNVRHDGINYLNIGSTMLMYIIPSIMVTALYTGLVYISSSSITRIQQYSDNNDRITIIERHNSIPNMTATNRILPNVTEARKTGAKICQSVTTLIIFFLVSTVPISCIEICLSITYSTQPLKIFLLYLKTVMCILHAIGEGALHREKRRRVMMFLYKYLSSTTSTSIVRRISRDVLGQAVIFHTNVQLSTLKEESIESIHVSDNVEQSNTVTQDEVFTADITLRKSSALQQNEYGKQLYIETNTKREKHERVTNRIQVKSTETFKNCGSITSETVENLENSDVKSPREMFENTQTPSKCKTPDIGLKQRDRHTHTSPKVVHRCKESAFVTKSIAGITRKISSSKRYKSFSPMNNYAINSPCRFFDQPSIQLHIFDDIPLESNIPFFEQSSSTPSRDYQPQNSRH